MKVRVKIKKLHEDAVIPQYQTTGAAGFDFHAIEDMEIPTRKIVLVKTGLSMEIPEGYELQVRPRSGMSLKTKMRIANSPGTIDSDYRGEICIIMENMGMLGALPYDIKKGDRIAQGVICPVYQAVFVEDELSETERGEKGFGSTNV
jgi:dUTP pyrophosphatase